MTRWNFIATAVLALCLPAAPRLSAQAQAPPQPPQAPQASSTQATAPQSPTARQTEPAPPSARPADVASPDAILAALYDVISGPAGKQRDWDRFRSLCWPGARMIPTAPKKDGGGFIARVNTPDEFIARASAYFDKDGFYEKEIARRAERYGNIAHVFSTYESRHDPKEAPFARGINSYQLFFDGSRWWVVTAFWQPETPEYPVPKEFLPAGNR